MPFSPFHGAGGAIDPFTGLTAAQAAAQAAAHGAPAAPGATGATGPVAPGGATGATGPAPLGNPNQGPLTGYNNWMTAGGVSPQQWQQLGGQPNTGFLNLGNWTQGGADPTNVQDNGNPLATVQPFIDNAYQQSTRQLDPQFQQLQARFDQDMVNKGIAPGSEAYNTAKQQFDQTKNDAYSQARNQAQQQGLGAQAQSFGQGLSQSTLANQLANSLIGANTSYANQQLGGNASLMNALLGGNSGIAQAMIGGNASMFNSQNSAGAQMGAAQLSHDLGMANLNQQGQQQDFGNLMTLLGLGQGVGQYNNSLLTSDQARQMQMYQGMPGGNGGNIDVQNPYNNSYTGQMNQWNYGNQQANAQNQNWAQYAAMFASLFGGG